MSGTDGKIVSINREVNGMEKQLLPKQREKLLKELKVRARIEIFRLRLTLHTSRLIC